MAIPTNGPDKNFLFCVCAKFLYFFCLVYLLCIVFKVNSIFKDE